MTPAPKEKTMTNQIPAGPTRKIAAAMRAAMRRDENTYSYAEFLDDMGGYIRDLEALLPPLPTLEDMTEEERAACQWMQCDAGPAGRRGVITNAADWHVYVVDKETGEHSNYSPDLVIPRPDLPRLEWPSEQGVDDVPPVKVGTVIESADDPRISALPVGTVLRDLEGEEVTKLYETIPEPWRGVGYVPIAGDGTEFGPWTVARLPKKPDQ